MNLEEIWRDCAYLNDLKEQPDALERTIKALEEQESAFAAALCSRPGGRVLLTGMGSSYWACKPLCLRLLACGFTPVLAETSEVVHHECDWLAPETLVVAVSQSGRSAETVRLLETARGRCEVLGVTNTPDSPLARESARVLMTCAGAESTVACKTYVATLLALEWLGEIVCGGDTKTLAREAREAAAQMRDYLRQWSAHVRELMRALDGVTDVFVVGRGQSLAAAGTGGLIIKEAAHIHAEGMSAAAFRHGPFEMLRDSVFVLVLEGDERSAPLNRKLAADISKSGARSAIVSPGSNGVVRIPACPDRMRPLMEILPVEMMTLALSAAKGRIPGRFELSAKVTDVE